jgi:4-aminobutyrate aminotransferase
MLHELESKGFVQNAAAMGKVFLAGLKKLEDKYECVGQARGLGLMLGIEIVESKATKKRDARMRNAILNAAVNSEKLMVLGAGENAIRFLPALNVTEEEIAAALGKIDRAIDLAPRAA